MNKRILFYGLVALLALTTMISCNDNPTNTGSIQEDENNNATQIENGKDMINSGVFKMKVKVGHLASQCSPGCLMINGKYYHADCMGQGNVCNLAATIKLTFESTISDIKYYNGITLYEYEFTTEEYFQFPARSLWVYNEFTGTECWMNVPEQLLVRDSNTHQFQFKGIYFSSKQAYANE
jgi:hypothetical protein